MSRGKHMTEKEIQSYVGRRFGNWTVTKYLSIEKTGARLYECRCKCGAVAIIQLFDLLNKRSSGCNACRIERNRKKFRYGSRHHKLWKRVNDIGCAPEWNDIEKMWDDIGLVVPNKKTLYKIDNDKPFGPQNYRWGPYNINASRPRKKYFVSEVVEETLHEIQARLGVSRQRAFQIVLHASGRCVKCSGEMVDKSVQHCESCREKLRERYIEKTGPARKKKRRDWEKIVGELKGILRDEKSSEIPLDAPQSVG